MVKHSGVSLRIARQFVIASFSCLSLSVAQPVFAQPAAAQAGWHDPRWESLSPSERVIIDRVAAEIYGEAMRAQAGWSAQGYGARYAGPHYGALAEPQKAPFRAYAINQLTGAAPDYGRQAPYQAASPAPYQSAPYQPDPYQAAPYQGAPEPAMRNEI